MPSVSASIASSARPEVWYQRHRLLQVRQRLGRLTSDSSCSERPCAKMRRDRRRASWRRKKDEEVRFRNAKRVVRSPGSRDRARQLGETRRVSPAGATGRHADREAREERDPPPGRLFKRSARSRVRDPARAPAAAGARARAACRLDAAPSRPVEVSGSPKSGEPRGRRVVGSQSSHNPKNATVDTTRTSRVRRVSACFYFLDSAAEGPARARLPRPRVAGHARESRRAFVSGAPRVCSPGVASVRVRRRRRERTERPRALGLLRRSRRQHHPRGGAVLDHRGLARGDGPSAPGVHRRGGSGEPRRRPAPDGPVQTDPFDPSETHQRTPKVGVLRVESGGN